MTRKSLAYEAMVFARAAHANQRRKYTGNPYADHLAEVAGIVGTVCPFLDADPLIVTATAWLHDCIEDQHIASSVLEKKFGSAVACAVLDLTNHEIGSRKERAAASRRRLGGAAGWIQAVKVADIISNTSSIVSHDQKFAAVYLEEKRLLLEALTKADHRLVALAQRQIVDRQSLT